MTRNKSSLKAEMRQELASILNFWIKHSIDMQHGGFYGKIDNNNIVFPEAEKGSVLNTRILWTFSAAYRMDKKPQYLYIAKRAYQYVLDHFLDPVHGGVYWSVDKLGQPLSTRKQIYAQAFALYGISEYYKISPEPEVLHNAVSLFEIIEKYSFDPENCGYLEAFSKEWNLLEDMRLSDKDRNDPKTMNTHLHIIEAYANLYQVWPDDKLHTKIIGLLSIFETHIINPATFQLRLFFDRQWVSQSDTVSFGHDIEASWLLPEAAGVLKDTNLTKKWKAMGLNMADTAYSSLNPDGSFDHGYNSRTHQRDKHREWWVSAEGMAGFTHACLSSNNKKYLGAVWGLWNFIQEHLLDKEKGEWFWGIWEDYSKMNEYKIGFWKCPYHNARACMEILKTI
jgi:mannobiose 2-epimerase